MDHPYIVGIDTPSCKECGLGKTWTVFGPNHIAMGVCFGEESEADSLAGMLNDAHKKGRAAGLRESLEEEGA